MGAMGGTSATGSQMEEQDELSMGMESVWKRSAVPAVGGAGESVQMDKSRTFVALMRVTWMKLPRTRLDLRWTGRFGSCRMGCWHVAMSARVHVGVT